MQINLTLAKAKALAHNLYTARNAKPEATLSSEYEAVAKAFKFRNWDALCASLRQADANLPGSTNYLRFDVSRTMTIDRPFCLVMELYEDSNAEGSCPEWGIIRVTQDLLDRIARVRESVVYSQMQSAVIASPQVVTYPESDSDGYHYNCHSATLSIDNSSIVARTRAKHSDSVFRSPWLDFYALNDELMVRPAAGSEVDMTSEVLESFWASPDLLVVMRDVNASYTRQDFKDSLIEALDISEEDTSLEEVEALAYESCRAELLAFLANASK